MGLNIKNERVHALARDAARLTGRTQTGAIELALSNLLRSLDADPTRVQAQQKIDVVRQIVADYQADPGDESAQIRSIDDLYDTATGLPR